MNTLSYKGYQGRFDYDPDADIFHGEVLHLNDVVTFQGRSIDELKQALVDAIEDYREKAFSLNTSRQGRAPRQAAKAGQKPRFLADDLSD